MVGFMSKVRSYLDFPIGIPRIWADINLTVEPPVCGFRVCSQSMEETIAQLFELYQYYDIGVRGSRKMKRWRDIFDGE